ncbi:MAG: CDP-alcohol phosphatidyltransferase, partial [Desulfobacterales bacterium]|nr:CDP-alcohol phosphatidyltransferase [Desulfobacterales bacterium]
IQQLPLGWIAGLYVLMGIARLIYFTLDKSPIAGFFKGMPTTAAALLAMSGLIIFSQAVKDASDWTRFWGVFSFGLVILAALLMNAYPIRYLHLGRFMSRHPWFGRSSLIVLFSVFTPYFGEACLIYMFLYTISPIITWRIRPEVAVRESQTKPAGVH